MRADKRRQEDPATLGRGELPLPDPYPDYVACPACGEPEVEVWCYEAGIQCHACGAWITHTPGDCRPPEE
jgi:hypothetical protein